MKQKKDILLCADCSMALDKEDIECCDNLALGKMFCKDCMFNKVSKLTGCSTEELEKYLLLDDDKFKIKMDDIKKNFLESFRKDGEFERH